MLTHQQQFATWDDTQESGSRENHYQIYTSGRCTLMKDQ